MRTIKSFLNGTNKVYFFLKSEDVCRKFYRDAEAEGLSFAGTPPTQMHTTDIIALLPSGGICYVGWAGRICYHNCPKGVIRIDYDKYKSGDEEYLIERRISADAHSREGEI